MGYLGRSSNWLPGIPIIGILDGDLTGSGDVARTIQFTATAPEVSATGKAKMYVMHILGDGTAEGKDGHNYSVGTVSENVLQVCDTSGCP